MTCHWYCSKRSYIITTQINQTFIQTYQENPQTMPPSSSSSNPIKPNNVIQLSQAETNSLPKACEGDQHIVPLIVQDDNPQIIESLFVPNTLLNPSATKDLEELFNKICARACRICSV